MTIICCFENYAGISTHSILCAFVEPEGNLFPNSAGFFLRIVEFLLFITHQVTYKIAGSVFLEASWVLAERARFSQNHLSLAFTFEASQISPNKNLPSGLLRQFCHVPFTTPLLYRRTGYKKKARVTLDHGPAKLLLLRQPGCPWGTRGFPSHDCSWFGFIATLLSRNLTCYRAISMPKGIRWWNSLI